ncbi:hypothetical protein [Chelativorans salis]|uniref:Uncharacterized protein n=1 Tax=Chelativorans salis TaxID=2978478 RepID=A0ABT2LR66_9HYPH|nr:hypothetical protein [Chelativorans sp. EGI FJ00035]MCT7376846.1 hypothetical protein [Chelativorans sp. EGI FJ00035]
MIKRIEALRIDPARVHSTGNEAQNIEVPGTDRIRSQQVDQIDLRTGRAQEADTPEQSAIDGVQEPFSSRRAQSPDEILAEYVAPDADLAILRRLVSILQHCITDVVPNLDGGAQFSEFATDLLKGEIDQCHALQERMQGGFEPD